MRLPRWLGWLRRKPKYVVGIDMAKGPDRTVVLAYPVERVLANALRTAAYQRGVAESPSEREVRAWLDANGPLPFSTNAVFTKAIAHFFPDEPSAQVASS